MSSPEERVLWVEGIVCVAWSVIGLHRAKAESWGYTGEAGQMHEPGPGEGRALVPWGWGSIEGPSVHSG